MKTKLVFSLLLAILAFVSAARAQTLIGTLSSTNNTSGFATSSSLGRSFSTNTIVTATGNFTSLLPLGGYLVVRAGTISGLSSTPISDSINDYLSFSGRVPLTGAQGTTPNYRFDFDLQTIAEDSYNSSTGVALFTGTGTLVDTTGAYQNTPADLTVDFSSTHNFTLTLDVPEPSAIALSATGLLGMLALCRRKA